jgi:pimeloyl-ACP methyl ester carboxylesterase
VAAATAALTVPSVNAASAPAAERPGSTSQGETLAGFQQGYVAVSGSNVHYVRGGSGPLLVLLHGWPESWWAFHDVMPSLAQHFTVVAFDLPGLGQSSAPAGGYDAATSAARIHQAVRKLGFTGPVNVLGHDMGVLIGYDYARDYPGEVTKVALLESALNGFGLENAYGLSFHFLLNQSSSPIPENIINNQLAVRSYLGAIFTKFTYNTAAIDQEAYFAAYANPAVREAGYNYYRAWPQNAADNQANAAKRLTIPVLAVGGQYAFGTGVAASLSQVADHVQTVVVPNSGHFIPEENPGYLSACATLFFAGSGGQPVPADMASCVTS